MTAIQRFFETHFGAIVFAILGMAIIPQLLFNSNIREFDADLGLLLISIVPAIFIILVSAIFKFPLRVQMLLAGFGLSIVLADAFFRPNLSLLDGSGTGVITTPSNMLLNSAVYFLIPLIAVIFAPKLKALFVNLAYIAVFGFLALSGMSTFQALTLPKIAENNAYEDTSEDKNPNIYLIWLDAMETGPMKKYLASGDSNFDFEGFTLFENNNANYPYTKQSYASFMSGSLYNGKSYEGWLARNDDLRKAAASQNYRITSYAKEDFLSELDHVSNDAKDIFKEATQSKHPFASDFTSYYISRSLPSLLGNKALDFGKGVGVHVDRLLNRNKTYESVRSISDGIEPVSGKLTLDKLIQDEGDRRGYNELVIAQAVIPHGPYVMNENCEYRGTGKPPLFDLYFDQVECSASLVETFLDTLKASGKYDSSLIIIFGDHGSGWAVEGAASDRVNEPLEAAYMPWTEQMLLSRASALLMIKPPQAKLPLQYSGVDSQLIDIFPTMVAQANMQLPATDAFLPIDGRDLFEGNNDGAQRDKRLYYFKPNNLMDPSITKMYQIESAEDGTLINLEYLSLLSEAVTLSPLQCGQALNFADYNTALEYYKASGLSGFEAFGRWSLGKKTHFTIAIDEQDCPSNELRFHYRTLLTDDHKRQRAKVYVNATLVSEVIVERGAKNILSVALDTRAEYFKRGQENIVSFEYLDAISPADLGLNTDSRELAYGFEKVTLE